MYIQTKKNFIIIFLFRMNSHKLKPKKKKNILKFSY